MLKHFYVNPKTNKDLLEKIEEEAKKRNRTPSFIVRERLRNAYGLKTTGGD